MNYIQYINNFSKKEIERKLKQMSDYMALFTRDTGRRQTNQIGKN
jgi:hypothetical protein